MSPDHTPSRKTTAARWQNLLASHSVSRQEADEKRANATAAQASAAAAAADYARLSALEDYKTIRAPFAGVVTARHTDIGQLVKADSDSDPQLFDLSDTHKLRLYVPIAQNYASVIRPGLTARLTVPEHPGQQFSAQLMGDSCAVDPRSGTLLAQFVAANPDGALHPGDYAAGAAGAARLLPGAALPGAGGGVASAVS